MLLKIQEPTKQSDNEQPEIAIGIDLGTSNSVVAVVRQGEQPEILADIDGQLLIPSVISFLNGRAIVGNRAIGMPNAVKSVKRLMEGKVPENFPYATAIKDNLPYVYPATNEGYSAIELSAEILKYLKFLAENHLESTIHKAVITVPAYFDDTARQATKDAAKLAGLEVLRLVNEPTAAALAYNLDAAKEGIYAIYDLGGGTFDISILRLEKGVFQVLSTGGDTALGGDDFDQAILDSFLCHVGYDQPLQNPAPYLSAAKEAKHKISQQHSANMTVVLPNNKDASHRFMKGDIEKILQPIIDKTLSICQKALNDSNIKKAEIQGVVLVGGSTRTPIVQQQVAQFFDQQPLTDLDPDTIVAQGAALQAHSLTGGKGALLLDVTPLSLGLETMGGLVEKIIPRNSPTPISKAQDFTTYQDGQTGLEIHVVQGEREMVADCRSLAKFCLSGIPPLTAGAARVRVQFNVDADGLLTVSATEQTTGQQQEIAVKPTYGISEEKMADMLYQSLQHGQADMQQRLLAQAKVDAKRVLSALDAALGKDGNLIDESERQEINQAALALQQAATQDNRDKITGAIEYLEKVSENFVEQRMNKAAREALGGLAV